MTHPSLRPTAISIEPEEAKKVAPSLWSRMLKFGSRRASASTLFKVALVGSLAAHAIGFAYNSPAEASEERIVQIPVMLEAEEAPPPPVVDEHPPPKPKPKRPASLPEKVEKVVEGDGLRTGDLVDAEAGDYTGDEPEPEPAPTVEEAPPPPPPPPAPPAPKVDKVKLTRAFLARVRGALASRKTYPFSAERMGVTGAVSVSFVIEPSGAFSNISVRRSSGHAVLDQAAMQTVRALSGQLRRPEAIGSVPLRTSVVLRYSLGS